MNSPDHVYRYDYFYVNPGASLRCKLCGKVGTWATVDDYRKGERFHVCLPCWDNIKWEKLSGELPQ